MKWLLVSLVVLASCNEPKVYECAGWNERPCVCPDGTLGTQKCSRGIAFSDPPPPRVWLPCSCCFNTSKDQWGVYYIEENADAGCWEDGYDPSIRTGLDTGAEE